MSIVTILGFLLVLIGLWGMLTQRNIIKIIIGFSIIDTGVHLIIVSLGYLSGRTAPIVDQTIDLARTLETMIDPLPSALVLTAIVIGLAITALMLVFAVKIYRLNGTLNIDELEELKW